MQADEIEDKKDEANVAQPAREVRYTRRLEDKILVAFHQACDQGEYEVAKQLVRVAEQWLFRASVQRTERRKAAQNLVAAHERLWLLTHVMGAGQYDATDHTMRASRPLR